MLPLTVPERQKRDRIPVVAERSFGACVTSIEVVAGEIVATLGDGRVLYPDRDEIVEVHRGAVLCTAVTKDATALLCCGDDGRLCRVAGQTVEVLFEGRRWIDAVAAHDTGAYAFAHGRTLTVVEAHGISHSIHMIGSVHGIAAITGGYAVAHRDGITLVSIGEGEAPQQKLLSSVGGHIAVSASPDGRFIVSATLDNSLNCWRMSDGMLSTMGGYSTKPSSLAWSDKGKWLVTSGETRVIVWPVTAKGGLGSKPPVLLAPSKSPVTVVACHPSADLIVAGYRDGGVVVARRKVRTVVPIRKPNGDEITAIALDTVRNRLAFGSSNGSVGALSLESIL